MASVGKEGRTLFRLYVLVYIGLLLSEKRQNTLFSSYLEDILARPDRVAKKMRMDFEMGTDGHRFVCFKFGISRLRRHLRGVTTARSSDVCNIPTNGNFFLYFHSECVIEPHHH